MNLLKPNLPAYSEHLIWMLLGLFISVSKSHSELFIYIKRKQEYFLIYLLDKGVQY